MRLNTLISKVKEIEKSDANIVLKERLKNFKSFKNKSTTDWFSELCFCILAANSKAVSSIYIQENLGYQGLFNISEKNLSKEILKNKHRFHNNKARYIIESREHHDIKYKIKELFNNKTINEVREWIAKNIKGIGYKEASHFLRNTGHDNIAILDRHIINTLVENEIIKRPKVLNREKYLEIENKFLELAKKYNISPAKLDLILWYMKTNQILK